MGWCVEMGREELLRIVCRHCACDPDDTDANGGTPLHTLVTLAEEEREEWGRSGIMDGGGIGSGGIGTSGIESGTASARAGGHASAVPSSSLDAALVEGDEDDDDDPFGPFDPFAAPTAAAATASVVGASLVSTDPSLPVGARLLQALLEERSDLPLYALNTEGLTALGATPPDSPCARLLFEAVCRCVRRSTVAIVICKRESYLYMPYALQMGGQLRESFPGLCVRVRQLFGMQPGEEGSPGSFEVLWEGVEWRQTRRLASRLSTGSLPLTEPVLHATLQMMLGPAASLDAIVDLSEALQLANAPYLVHGDGLLTESGGDLDATADAASGGGGGGPSQLGLGASRTGASRTGASRTGTSRSSQPPLSPKAAKARVAKLGLVGADGSLSSSSAFNNPLLAGASPVQSRGGGGGGGMLSQTRQRETAGGGRGGRTHTSGSSSHAAGRRRASGGRGGENGGGGNRYLPPLGHSASEPALGPDGGAVGLHTNSGLGLDSARGSAIYDSGYSKRGGGGRRGVAPLPRVPLVKRTLSSDWLLEPFSVRRRYQPRKFLVQPLYDSFEVECERLGGNVVAAARNAIERWTDDELERLAIGRAEEERADSLRQVSNTSSIPPRG